MVQPHADLNLSLDGKHVLAPDLDCLDSDTLLRLQEMEGTPGPARLERLVREMRR